MQMGQIGQMLNQNNFLGGLGNLEGSILIGIVSIVYSLAIAVIPFIAKRIVSGDVGSTAAAMVGTAVTALTAGAAGIEGAAAGVAAARAGSAGASLRFRGRRSHRRICARTYRHSRWQPARAAAADTVRLHLQRQGGTRWAKALPLSRAMPTRFAVRSAT